MSFRVLVVDDDQVVADTLALALSQNGYLVQHCYDAAEAMRMASKFTPDLLVTALMMQDGTGIELAQYYATYRPECKVLLISGFPRAAELAAKFLHRHQYMGVLPKQSKDVLGVVAQCARGLSFGEN